MVEICRVEIETNKYYAWLDEPGEAAAELYDEDINLDEKYDEQS